MNDDELISTIAKKHPVAAKHFSGLLSGELVLVRAIDLLEINTQLQECRRELKRLRGDDTTK